MTEIDENPVWVTFFSPITLDTGRMLVNAVIGSAQQGRTGIHCLLQTPGGSITDAVALFNFVQSAPIPVTYYNVGSICSAGVIAFLGAETRCCAETGLFMIHSTSNQSGVSRANIAAIEKSIALDDARAMTILQGRTKLATERLAAAQTSDLWLSASEALEAGVCTEIRTFTPRGRDNIFFI